MKSICVVCDAIGIGGVSRCILDLLPILSKKYKVTLFVLSGEINELYRPQIPDEITIVCGNFEHNKSSTVYIRLFGSQYFKRIITGHYDILICCKSGHLGIVSSKVADNYIYWNHEEHYMKYAVRSSLTVLQKINYLRLKRLLRKYTEIWHVNKTIANKYDEAFPKTNNVVIPNALDCESIIRKSNDRPVFDSLNNDLLKIVMVGRLSPEKGFDRVLNAISIIENKEYVVLVIGEGYERGKLEGIIKANNLENNVKLCGEQTNPYKYMQLADVVICPSYTESFGLVPLEAMLLKKPVIMTRTNGFVYVTENGKYGYLIDNTNDSVCKVMERVIYDSGKFLEMYRCNHSLEDAYRYALTFDISNYANRIYSRLGSILSQSKHKQ